MDGGAVKVKLIVSRMWNLHFVVSIGMLAIAVSMTLPHGVACISAVLVGWSGGVAFVNWIDEFAFERYVGILRHLQEALNHQQKTIQEQRKMLDEMAALVDRIGDPHA